MVTQKVDPIHEAVQQRYGAIARSGGAATKASCCDNDSCNPEASEGSCDCSPQLYDEKLLEGLPIDVTGLSLGCGDPVTIASLKPGEIVVDLGSGAGIDCFLASRQVGEGGFVIGVDMTYDMLDRANANRAKMGVTNVEFRKGQIEALPVDSNSVDVVMSNCVINLSPDKLSVFQEAYRVLKPGGRISVSDIVTQGAFSPESVARLDQWAACVTGAIDAGEYTGLMRDAGFEDISVVDKVDADKIVTPSIGMPRIFSARITARKPAGR